MDLVKRDANGFIDFSNREVIETLKQTVCKGASDEEMMMFAELCRSSGLNPFQKEIWFIKTKSGAQIMTGINGYLKIANKHPQYDGLEVTFEEDDKGNIISAECRVYRKDRKFPSVGLALMKEFRGNTPIWNEKPSVMLGKVAKSIALREAFPQEMNGLYTEEEMPKEFERKETPPPKKDPNILEFTDPKTGVVTEMHFNKAIDEGLMYMYSIPKGTTPEQQNLIKAEINQKRARLYSGAIYSPEPLETLKDNCEFTPERAREPQAALPQ